MKKFFLLLSSEKKQNMPNFICATCGVQFAASEAPPAHCPICEDERQYVNWNGQEWTTLEKLRSDHHNVFKAEEPNLTGFGIEPRFAMPALCEAMPTIFHYPRRPFIVLSTRFLRIVLIVFMGHGLITLLLPMRKPPLSIRRSDTCAP